MNDLCEVARSIVWSHRGVANTAGRTQAVDLALQRLTRQSIYLYFNRLAWTHIRQLGFPEIGRYIDRLKGDKRQQGVGARLNLTTCAR